MINSAMDPTVKKAARSIMMVFKQAGTRAGGFVNYGDFGKALRWEAGYIKHDVQREALAALVERGYVVELNAGLELTDRGARSLEKL
jgi:hypothetical protein